MNSFIDNIFVIHLSHRFDREAHIKKQFNELNLKYQFFEAINGYELRYNGKLLKGEEGIRQTHLQILQYAKTNNLDHLFICEDDVVFDERMLSALEEATKNDFDILYLGGNHKEQPYFVKQGLLKVNNTVCLHAVIIKKHMYDLLIRTIINNYDLSVDDAYALIQDKYNVLCTYPHLAWQKEDYSDIQNKFVKYEWLKPQ
jgi:GR25 family glycosyltransferase involved in LPS biosynthesis